MPLDCCNANPQLSDYSCPYHSDAAPMLSCRLLLDILASCLQPWDGQAQKGAVTARTLYAGCVGFSATARYSGYVPRLARWHRYAGKEFMQATAFMDEQSVIRFL